MSMRFNDYSIKGVKPAEKQDMLEKKLGELVHLSYLKDVTILERFTEFCKENNIQAEVVFTGDYTTVERVGCPNHMQHIVDDKCACCGYGY